MNKRRHSLDLGRPLIQFEAGLVDFDRLSLGVGNVQGLVHWHLLDADIVSDQFGMTTPFRNTSNTQDGADDGHDDDQGLHGEIERV